MAEVVKEKQVEKEEKEEEELAEEEEAVCWTKCFDEFVTQRKRSFHRRKGKERKV